MHTSPLSCIRPLAWCGTRRDGFLLPKDAPGPLLLHIRSRAEPCLHIKHEPVPSPAPTQRYGSAQVLGIEVWGTENLPPPMLSCTSRTHVSDRGIGQHGSWYRVAHESGNLPACWDLRRPVPPPEAQVPAQDQGITKSPRPPNPVPPHQDPHWPSFTQTQVSMGSPVEARGTQDTPDSVALQHDPCRLSLLAEPCPWGVSLSEESQAGAPGVRGAWSYPECVGSGSSDL